ncbi:MAG: tRNA uridine-5-carboxymethylaminomethyl(34) synthesis GTPase MnmE [Fimbriimonadales bacterium]|nr:tRNA uridine-5-carboxymethylaminomethyl(34) synthesis GTPase MnmE [Fimbriimonadales bacterium]
MPADTIAAIATPIGEGGIGVIRISGAGAIQLAARVFRRRNKKPLQSHRVYYGAIVDPDTGETLDQVLLIPFHAPHSYTGEDVAELHCHGSPYLLRRVLELLCRQGARPAQPGEFTLRAFLNGKLDLAQAEAVADLIRACSDAQLRSALALHAGKLSQQVQRLSDELLGVLASVEAHIDFSDEIGELDPAVLTPPIENLIAKLDALLKDAQAGRILREGARVAIVGRPNVGKSSLLNALLGAERAIVTDIPGTTRDTIEESFQIEGVPVVILDTAGLRESADVVEQIGIERARRAAEQADLILFVYDLTAQDYTEDLCLLESLPAETPKILVGNKVDLVCPHPQPLSHAVGEGGVPATVLSIEATGSPSPTLWARRLGSEGAILISALTGFGLDALKHAILNALHLQHIGEETPALTHTRHIHAVQQARDHLHAALRTLQQNMPPDLVAVDLRSAWLALGTITGVSADEELVNRIFRDFCIGK